VRELRNVVERAVILGRSERLARRDLSPIASDAARPGPPRAGDAVTLEELERAHIAAVMVASPTLDGAAGTLGIDPSTLWRKRKQYGI
ncbi:MAG: helix-turn-helix domain-containing protein, partial [Candidatus Competibacter sp.]|nr:helix-turn-helix domain-containing protein [Candidatus Competibacter sp.]